MEMENDLTIKPGTSAQEMGQQKLGHLLVVDDEAQVLNPLCEFLSEFGYDAEGFTSATEGLKALKNQTFDLLLTDVIMPEMDGVSLLKTALEIDPQMVGIIITGNGTIETAVEAMKVGAFDYVLKPVEFRTLMPILSRAMSVRRLKTENLQLRERHKSLIESARDVIYTLSPGGLVTSLNSAFETITGWSRVEWIGKPFSSLLHPDDLPSALKVFHGALCGEISPTLELRVRARSGEYLVGEFIMPPLIADGKVIGISGIARDITERKRAEEKLRALMEELSTQKEFSDAIYHNTPSGIMVLDKEGHILKINHPGADILELSPSEVMGTPLTTIYPEAKEMLTLDTHFGREILITLADGKTRPVGFTNSPLLDKDGMEKGIVIVFRDLIEIKELQAELRKKQHFEAMGKVISGVAHEIRNPLFGIQAIAQILERESESPQHQALISALLKETQRMRNLVDELLLYSRPSVLNLIEMDLDIFLAELKEFFRTKHHDKVLSINVPPLTRFRADKDKLMQVFMNLLENASGAGSKKIDITSEKRDGALRIAVKDDGAGIKPDALERIFEPFFTTKKEGTGLGLPICRKIMEAHRGTIEVESTMGTGTTFFLTFKEQ